MSPSRGPFSKIAKTMYINVKIIKHCRLTENINLDGGGEGSGDVVVGGLADVQGVQVRPGHLLQVQRVSHLARQSATCDY